MRQCGNIGLIWRFFACFSMHFRYFPPRLTPPWGENMVRAFSRGWICRPIACQIACFRARTTVRPVADEEVMRWARTIKTPRARTTALKKRLSELTKALDEASGNRRDRTGKPARIERRHRQGDGDRLSGRVRTRCGDTGRRISGVAGRRVGRNGSLVHAGVPVARGRRRVLECLQAGGAPHRGRRSAKTLKFPRSGGTCEGSIVAAGAGPVIDPIHQFQIHPIIPIHMFGYDLSLTNSGAFHGHRARRDRADHGDRHRRPRARSRPSSGDGRDALRVHRGYSCSRPWANRAASSCRWCCRCSCSCCSRTSSA
jgi:hypothetical protein